MGQYLVVTPWSPGHVRESVDVQTCMSCSSRWHRQPAIQSWTLSKGCRQTASRSDRNLEPVLEELLKALAMLHLQKGSLGVRTGARMVRVLKSLQGSLFSGDSEPTDRDGITKELM